MCEHSSSNNGKRNHTQKVVYKIAKYSSTHTEREKERSTINHASNVICQQCVVVFSCSIACVSFFCLTFTPWCVYIYVWWVWIECNCKSGSSEQLASQLGSELKAADEPQNETNTITITIVIIAQTIDEQYISHFTCASHLFFCLCQPTSNVFY